MIEAYMFDNIPVVSQRDVAVISFFVQFINRHLFCSIKKLEPRWKGK